METSGRRPISILYFSGTGGTRLLAELLRELLEPEAELLSVSDPRAREAASSAGLLVLCFPTYFLKPAPAMRDFIEGLGPFDPPRPAYLLATYELYPENCLRAAALALGRRGVEVLGYRAVRAPGSDATAFLPARLSPWLYRFEPGMARKLASVARELRAMAEGGPRRPSLPARRWYTPFSRLLQVLVFDRFEGRLGRISVLPERCDRCGACVRGCERGAWSLSEGELRRRRDACDLCMRCVHRCPRRALVLFEGLKDNPRLDAGRYAGLGERARAELGLAGGAGRIEA